MVDKELPHHDQLRNCSHVVAGHDGTMCDADGELFIKPCTQAEVDFYQSAGRFYPEFAKLMPLFLGSLTLDDSRSTSVDAAVAGMLASPDRRILAKEETTAPKSEDTLCATGPALSPAYGKKIATDMAIVLDNATSGFQKANILDIKLGVRLWADDATEEKKQRFDKVSSETTHASLGFRIAGMKIFKGSENNDELDSQGYKVYDKDYGRYTVNTDNIADELRRFIFNGAAGIDEELGRAICDAFCRDLKRVHEAVLQHESRMYSSSLLFVFEGDGNALRSAIEQNNAHAKKIAEQDQSDLSSRRIDSGIGLDEGEELDDNVSESAQALLPPIYALKLIDFAHARWTPGQGPDENMLIGIRNLERIFQEIE